MRTIRFSAFLLAVSVVIILPGCNDSPSNSQKAAQISSEEAAASPVSPLAIGDETKLLLKELVDNGDYVNSQDYPSLIKASIVHENIGKNMLVVDIRSARDFSEGHISGSVNKKVEDIPSYFESGIKPFEYDRIIIVCSNGALSSYTTSLLRLMGYGNVYAMRWGMSAWNRKFADQGWLKNLSGKYEARLETAVNEKSRGTTMPELKTGMATGPDIAAARFKKLFADGGNNILVSADEVFADPSKYYIINLERKDKYEDGHIPGAVRYKPESTLGFPEEMACIPADKTVVVYCGTGHNSGFATAYLRLFGYDARTLNYGNNGFMYDRMVSQRSKLSWLPFSAEDVNDFEFVK